VALANTTENIDILAVTEFVSASGPEKTNTTNAIATGLAEMGRTYTLAELNDMNQIATGAIDLLNYDVVIFYEQEQTDAATMESFGATIETQLKTFVTSNGVLIACDGSGHETSALFRGADVLDVSGGASATDDTLTVVDTSDLLASGISESYIGPSTTRSYDTVSNDTVVVEDATGRPVVFHREGDMSWEWVFIPAGNFDMGSTEGQSDELPVHAVSVPAFYMNRTEVTVASYQKCVTTGPCTVPDDGSTALNWNVANRDEYPINGVTVAQAEVFCAWAGGRLPSEAEWEYAAKNAGQDVRFPWGSTMPSCDYTVMKATSNGCNTGLTMPVCSKEAGNTTQGLCDMIGNVWEFVADKITTNYIGAPTDGSVWENNGGTRPTIRGASMDNPNTGVPSTVTLTTTYRHAIDSDETRYNVGFRCARDIQ
jgi:formylglycine-generating enzyme required for sulfatase activity